MRPPAASNVLAQRTFDADTEASYESTVCPAVVIRFPVLTARRDRGLSRTPDQRRRAHPDPAIRRADPAHRAVRRRTRRPTRSHAHPAVAPEHGPPAGLRHPRRLRRPKRPRHPAVRPRLQAHRRPPPRGFRPRQSTDPLAVRERRLHPRPVAAPRRAGRPFHPVVRLTAAPPHL